MAQGTTSRCMCNAVFVLMYVNIAFYSFVRPQFGCVHNLKQTYDSVSKKVVCLGKRISAPGSSMWRPSTEVGMSPNNYKMSADVNNYHFEYV